jgi:hypothetical protein
MTLVVPCLNSPTIESEMIAMCPQGVSLHFNRMVARGAPGALDGQAERNSRYRRTSADRFWSRFGPELPHTRHCSGSIHRLQFLQM